MKIKFSLIFTIFIVTLCLFWVYSSLKARNENDSVNNIVEQERIDLHFGHQGVDDFITQQSGMDMHPVGMGFMDLYWSPPNLGKVRVMTENSDLAIDHIFKITGVNFNRSGVDGVQVIDIVSSLHHEEYISQRDAYHAYVELMTQLNDKGWKQHFLLFSARIDKRDNFKHMTNTAIGEVIDPTYILSFDEWQDYSKSMLLRLYNDDVILGIVLKRKYRDTEADQEQYMMRYSFETFRYNTRNLISGSYKMNSEEFEKAFKQGQIDDRKSRHEDEVRMREKGYRIDETYVDQDIWQYVR